VFRVTVTVTVIGVKAEVSGYALWLVFGVGVRLLWTELVFGLRFRVMVRVMVRI